MNDKNDAPPPSRKENAWRNDFSFERDHLSKAGYMKGAERRGWWEITPKGHIYLYELIEKARRISDFDQARITPVLLQELFAEELEEMRADRLLIEQISRSNGLDDSENSEPVIDEPRPRAVPNASAHKRVYPRNAAVAKRALKRAGYCCEADPRHASFICRDGTHPYMEPHHLIPLSSAEYFDVDLDREQNIFSLCSTCHNQIHYGRKEDVRKLLSRLFLSRENEICAILGRRISLDELYQLYGVVLL